MSQNTLLSSSLIRRTILVCALGYFVDLFDIQLFAVLRAASLTDLGVPLDRQSVVGGNILNVQLLGMVLGAFLWGFLGDRFGRLKALYGSILVYSIGTLACAFVQNTEMYGLLRFVTGFGLAGETGAAVTLVAEMMAPQKRAWGVTIVGAVAFLGPALAVLISYVTPWRETYIVTGILGLGLFALRMKLLEPALFQKTLANEIHRGSLKLLLLQSPQRNRFILCILVGVPMLFSWQFMNFFAGEIGKAILPPGEAFDPKLCLLVFYLGSSLGDVLAGALSQYLNSRRKPIFAFYAIGLLVTGFYLLAGPSLLHHASALYAAYFCLGITSGGLILYAMMSAEQFGTNLRATTSITLINLVRGSNILTILAFQALRGPLGVTHAAMLIAFVLYVVAFFCLRQLHDTHGTDLDFVETAGI